MSETKTDSPREGFSRRGFLKNTAAVGAASVMAKHIPASLAQSAADPIRVGLIGCGGRGTGAASDTIKSSENVHVVAMADAFEDRLKGSRENLNNEEELKGKFLVEDDHCFVGFDAYKELLALDDIDMVILAAPPGFRPLHLEAAVAAGKHIFAEKPFGVDPAGIRKVIAAAKAADQKGLKIVGGTQRRHQAHYLEAMKHIHNGDLGKVISMNVYWNGGTLWYHRPEADWTEMENQMRNWYYYNWLCGDHIVEQHVHNLDVGIWALNDQVPVRCWGLGGRQVRVEAEFGEIFDHFAIEYEFADGTIMSSQCRQMKNTKNDVREVISCQNGKAYLDSGAAKLVGAVEKEWKDSPNPYVVEHTDLIDAIRNNKPLNEAERVANATMLAIMGRVAAYTGKEVTWDFMMNESKLDLTPPKYEWGDAPAPKIATPGKTPLV
jgi:predicted dehydrogenase